MDGVIFGAVVKMLSCGRIVVFVLEGIVMYVGVPRVKVLFDGWAWCWSSAWAKAVVEF